MKQVHGHNDALVETLAICYTTHKLHAQTMNQSLSHHMKSSLGVFYTYSITRRNRERRIAPVDPLEMEHAPSIH